MKNIFKWMKKMKSAKLKILKIVQGKMSKISKMDQIESSSKIKINNFKTLILILREYQKDLPHF